MAAAAYFSFEVFGNERSACHLFSLASSHAWQRGADFSRHGFLCRIRIGRLDHYFQALSSLILKSIDASVVYKSFHSWKFYSLTIKASDMYVLDASQQICVSRIVLEIVSCRSCLAQALAIITYHYITHDIAISSLSLVLRRSASRTSYEMAGWPRHREEIEMPPFL